MSTLFSLLQSTAVALPTDYMIINSGNPPTTKKIQLTGLQTYFAGTAFQIATNAPNTPVGIGYMSIAGSPQASGVTNIDVAIVPKGNGALIASIPDNLIAGGNKRGQFAVDWQMSRTAPGQVGGGNYSVLAGGQNNAIGPTFTHCVIGGGFQNSIQGGAYNTISGGNGNLTGLNSNNSIGGGNGNIITLGVDNTIGGGNTNLIPTANGATISGGVENTAGPTFAAYGVIPGGYRASLRGIYGAYARASGRRAAVGDAQEGGYIFRTSTTNATPTRMTTDGTGSVSNNTPILSNNSSRTFAMETLVRNSATGDTGRLEVKGVIKRGANAAATAIAGTNVNTTYIGDASLSAVTCTVTADTTNGGMNVTFTGIAATNIDVVSVMRTVENG